MRVEDINIRKVLSSNLQKAIEVEIKTKRGLVHSIAPVNKNGIYRIYSLPVEEAVKKFLEIKRHFVNQTFDSVEEVDAFLRDIDISVDFREIGGNLAFAISSAFLKAFAQWENLEVCEYLSKGKSELPVPLAVIIDKSKSQTDLQEFLLYPVQQKIFSKSIMKLVNIYNELEFDGILTIEKILKTLSKLTTQNALEIGINFGASAIWNGRKYQYNTGENLTSQEQLLFVQDIASAYPVGYIEDPFHEDDFILFATLTHRIPTRVVAGDDLYSNNLERIKKGIELKTSSGMVITPDQMGTITDVINAVKEAKKNKIVTIITGNSDTNLISHLAVGLKFDNIKLRMDSTSAEIINELIRIEEKL